MLRNQITDTTVNILSVIDDNTKIEITYKNIDLSILKEISEEIGCELLAPNKKHDTYRIDYSVISFEGNKSILVTLKTKPYNVHVNKTFTLKGAYEEDSNL